MTEDINETKSIRVVYLGHCMQDFKKAENNLKGRVQITPNWRQSWTDSHDELGK